MTQSAEYVEPCKPEDFEEVLDVIAEEKGYSSYQELRNDYARSIGRLNWNSFKMKKGSQRMRVSRFKLYRDFTEDTELVRAKYQEFGEICRGRLKLMGKNLEWLSNQTRCTEIFLNALFDGEVPCQKDFMKKISDALKFEKKELEQRGFYVEDSEE